MSMHAESVSIQRVENGWVVVTYCAGSSLNLVAKTIEEVTGFIRGMQWQTPRPLPPPDTASAQPTQALAGRSY